MRELCRKNGWEKLISFMLRLLWELRKTICNQNTGQKDGLGAEGFSRRPKIEAKRSEIL